MKGRFKLILKTLVSITCLAAVFYIVDVHEVLSLISHLRISDIVIACCLMVVGHIGSGLRFQYILARLGRRLTKGEAIKVSFVALWFNQLLPTGMGGDLVRVVFLANKCGRIRIALAALLDRGLGLLWMILMVLFFLPIILFDKLNSQTIILVASGCVAILSGALVIMFFNGKQCRVLPAHVYRICRIILLIGHSLRRVILSASIYKLIFYLSLSFFPYVFYVAVIGSTYGVAISMLEYCALVPIMFISMQFPISVGGWGVRELSAIYVFSYMGMSDEQAIIISLLYGVGLLVTSIPGNIFWMYRRSSV